MFYPKAQAYPPSTEPEDELAQEVDQLRREIQQLREEGMTRQRSAESQAAPQPETKENRIPTILIFRNGRREEVQNYAIMWIVTEQQARKLPLSELDLEATRKANKQRGVEFLPPSQP